MSDQWRGDAKGYPTDKVQNMSLKVKGPLENDRDISVL